MNKENQFLKTVCSIAVPVTLQSMLQSSFSMIDQIMIGQLGSANIAGIGLASKFSSIFSVLVSAIAAVAGIMISQYIGKKDEKNIRCSFYINLLAALGLAAIFTVLCVFFSSQIIQMYTSDPLTNQAAAGYLQIMAFTNLPIAGATILSTLLRCRGKASLPLYASILAAVINTGLNYVFIFGKFGFAPMGVNGAALATVIAQLANFLFVLIFLLKYNKKQNKKIPFTIQLGNLGRKQYLVILIPILITEFLWSLGENVYAVIYGHMGTQSCAAMTLTNPIQGLMIGALTGLAQAAGIIIGKTLGSNGYEQAYHESKKLMRYGLYCSVGLSVLLLLLSGLYVQIYQVEDAVKATAVQILTAYAVISPVKVQNMILGGGILRSGGKTKYVMWIDIVGTWAFGVPLGLLSSFVWNLPIPWVYFILSLEECVRLTISLIIFRKKKWMQSLHS